ncbi:MAG: LamG domain-containing protein, partial [Phycisphaerales bacterium]
MSKKLIYLTCFVLVLSVAGNASAQLIAHYKLDETGGTVVNDSSGKDNHAEVGGDPVWTEGLKDGALEFDGDDFVTLPAENMGLRSDAGSVAFWMKMVEEDVEGINTIWWGGDNTTGTGMGPENEMHIHVESAVTDVWIGGEICFRVKHTEPLTHLHSDPEKAGADDPGAEPNNPILVNTGRWHHVAGTWGDDEGTIKLYLDGELLQQADYDPISYPLSYMYLGQMAAGNRMYTGLLDE